MTRRALALLLAAAALPCGCRRASAPPRFREAPLVIVSIDTLRADHLPAYGYKAVETPHLDRFRKDAILYENAYAHVPLTLPSHASILTGRLPFEHGVRDNLGYRLDAQAQPTLASLLKARGYATGAAVSAWVMRGATGLADGFDLYEDHIAAPQGGADAAGRVQRRGGETLALARGWLDGVSGRPFFLFFHIYEPHAPYEPPEPFKSRYALAYDGEVAAADAIVGGLLDDLRGRGVYDQAIVMVLSDHGEGLGEHGEDDHGILLYRWALHVPLLLKLPRSERAGTTVASPVALIDVVPTAAALLGLQPPKGLRGRSLLDPADRGRIYAETFYPRIHLGWSDLRSLVDARYQYVEGARRELYDVAADPGERADLAAANGDAVRARQKELAELPAAFTLPRQASGEEMERLAALGYLGGVAGETRGPLPDPRESIPVLADVKAAFRLAASGRDQEAAATLRSVLHRFPDLFDARYELAQTLTRLGRYPEAYEQYRAALRTSPSLAGAVALDLGRVCLKLGRTQEAEANARVAVLTNPAQGHELLARIALSRDDLAGAEREARAVAGDPPAEAAAAVVRAEVEVRRGRFAEALAVVAAAQRTLAENGVPPVPDLDFMRGDALARLGRYGEAAGAFEAEIRAFPRNAQAYTHLAIVYGLLRRPARDVDRVLAAMVAADPRPETRELAAKTLESMGDAVGARAWRRRAARP